METPWTLKEAIELLVKIKPKTEIYGYYPALYGSVLYKGESYHDLDIVFVVKESLHTDYRPKLDAIKDDLNIEEYHAIERPEECFDYKLVIYAKQKITGNKYNLFFPNFSFAGRLDNFRSLDTDPNYN